MIRQSRTTVLGRESTRYGWVTIASVRTSVNAATG